MKVSCGFGGGMYLGSVCGAVTGGIMAIGVKYGGFDRKAQFQTIRVTKEFADRFKAKHKSVNCPDLTGFDVSTLTVDDLGNPEKLKGLFDERQAARCLGYVKDATAIVSELIADAPKA